MSVSSDPAVAILPEGLLAELRVEIDRIDAAMHGLLIERSAVIDRLIAIKARQGGGSAFRPQREAEMMRRLAERHHGLLPLDAVESIWRIIISTFTYVQATYAVHADAGVAPVALRDSARFHFGFTVPLVTHAKPAAVVQAVAASGGDLGLLPVDRGSAADAWWTALVDPAAPKIIARLPFIGRPDHPAALPLYVVAQPVAEAASREVGLWAIHLDGGQTVPDLSAAGASVVASVAADTRLSLLVAAPGDVSAESLRAALRSVGANAQIAPVGSHAAPFDLASPPDPSRSSP